MGSRNRKRDRSTLTHETHIGSVIGQVHTGSGNIVVGSFSGGTISNKDEFLAALREFKAELEATSKHRLPENTTKRAIVEVEGIEQEATKENPTSLRIIKKLKNVQDILIAGTTTATAATSAAEKLVPMIHTAIQYASKIFGS